ncbi:MAG: serine hydrolase domain-containing protein [Hyphomicrobiales bacterium]
MSALGQTIDTMLQSAVSAGDVPGVVAAVTTADETLYEAGFGERVQGTGVEMTPDTVGWIASMTKAVTGAVAMQQVERGALDLDSPASTWAPELGAVQVLERFGDDGEPVLRPPGRPITLRNLLTHTAGFGYDIWNGDLVRYQEVKDIPGIISCQNLALTTPLLFDPGERWQYGINIDWAGKLVEAATGKTLGQVMHDDIFEPLGMTSTAFKMTEDMRSRMAKIHQRGGDDSFEPQMELEIPQDPEFEMGGGGLYSTAGDYLKFVRMILNKGAANGHQVLNPETVAAMSVNQMDDCRVCVMKTVMPPLSNDAEFFPGLEKTWGLSFMINEAEAPTGRSAGSLAWAGLANSFYWIDPVKGVGGVYMTQILPFADKKSLPLFYDFENAVYQSLT